MDYYEDDLSVYDLIRHLFVAGCATCFLLALHRLARGVILSARVAAYDEFAEAYTPEEREVLIHRAKRESLRY